MVILKNILFIKDLKPTRQHLKFATGNGVGVYRVDRIKSFGRKNVTAKEQHEINLY